MSNLSEEIKEILSELGITNEIKKPKPVLLFYVSIANVQPQNWGQLMQSFATTINDTIDKNEYYSLVLATKQEEHRVEMLNPNTNDEDLTQNYLKKLDEIKKHSDETITNLIKELNTENEKK